ncbi:MAG: AAA family ATPase [Pseudomonadota bacterium]
MEGGLQDRSGLRAAQELQVVALTSQKGGSGKTTMTGHLAVQAARTGKGPVAIIDTDPQGSIAGWGRSRTAEDPAVFTAVPSQLPGAIAALRAEGFKLVFVDTPPAVTEAISDVVSLSDLVLIPTRPSPHDLRAVGATVDIVETHNRSMIFIVNSATRGARITAEAAVALSQHGTVAPVTVHHRVDYAASMIDGRTVMEVKEESRSAKEIIGLWEYIADRLDRLRTEAIEAAVYDGVSTDSPLQIIDAPAVDGLVPNRPVVRGGFGRRLDGPRPIDDGPQA